MSQEKKASAVCTHRQAIVTRYAGPTDRSGSRVYARAEAGSAVWSWDHALNTEQNHARACEKLADKFNWDGEWRGAGSPDGRGYVWVPIEPAEGSV